MRKLQDQRGALVGRRLEPEAKRTRGQPSLGSRKHSSDSSRSRRRRAGASTIRKAVEIERDLRVLDARHRTSAEIRAAAEELATTLGRPVDVAKGASDLVADLAAYIAERIAAIERRDQLRATAQRLADELVKQMKARASHDQAVTAAKADVERMTRRIKEADRRRDVLKKVRADAEAARTRIVRRVFNSSLNRLWRDLFARLAPDEPFVPFFNVAEGSRAVAVLATAHREGDRFGSPDVMLSAGNLNTAALTLFFALHLSVEQRLPWLLLDDPVQSMDEVHVAQFAALLRTLAREHARRIVIAVRERPLFDYLALELSPGRRSESLVTVELSRSQEGTTLAEPQYHVFGGDPALAVA